MQIQTDLKNLIFRNIKKEGRGLVFSISSYPGYPRQVIIDGEKVTEGEGRSIT